MNSETKLILAIDQVNKVISLIEGNEYQTILNQYLVSVRVELQRQLNVLTNTNVYSKMKESN
jgi:hypothetical protein